MSIEDLQKDLDAGTFRRIYGFYGAEPYLKRFYLDRLIDAVLPQGRETDLHRYEGKEADLSVFSEELWLYSPGGRKVMLLYDLPVSSPIVSFLTEDACEIPEDTVVIFYWVTETPDWKTAAAKKLKSKIGSDGLLIPVDTPDDSVLTRWVTQQFRRRGSAISPDGVAFFLSVEERNMGAMLTEIEKISSYCGAQVTQEALERLCVRTVQARAYELNDLILEGKADRAYEVLRTLNALKTPPYVILSSLFSCFANLYKLKVLSSADEATKMTCTGLKAYPVKKYSARLKQVSLANLDRLMGVCAEIDVLSKSTSADGDLLVVRLIGEALKLL